MVLTEHQEQMVLMVVQVVRVQTEHQEQTEPQERMVHLVLQEQMELLVEMV